MHTFCRTGKQAGISRKWTRGEDPFLDRRSGEDRRYVYSLEYFRLGRPDRRDNCERRKNYERRKGFVRVSLWSSACPDYNEQEWLEGRIEL